MHLAFYQTRNCTSYNTNSGNGGNNASKKGIRRRNFKNKKKNKRFKRVIVERKIDFLVATCSSPHACAATAFGRALTFFSGKSIAHPSCRWRGRRTGVGDDRPRALVCTYAKHKTRMEQYEAKHPSISVRRQRV